MPATSTPSPSRMTDPGLPEDLHDLILLPRLVVVVPEDTHGGDAERGGQLAREHARLLGQPVVRRGRRTRSRTSGLGRWRRRSMGWKRALRRLGAVQVTDGGDAHRRARASIPAEHRTGWESDGAVRSGFDVTRGRPVSDLGSRHLSAGRQAAVRVVAPRSRPPGTAPGRAASPRRRDRSGPARPAPVAAAGGDRPCTASGITSLLARIR